MKKSPRQEAFGMSYSPKFAMRLIVLVLAVVCSFLTTPTQAALINPPAPFPIIPDFFASCPGCTQLATASSVVNGTDALGNVHWQASFVTAVFNDPAPIAGIRAGAGLDFFYQITDVSPCAPCTVGPDNIGRVTANNFSSIATPGLLVDVGVNVGAIPGFNPAGTAFPGLVDRFPPGDTIGWSFTAPGSIPLTPGSTSIILEVATNATNFKPGSFSALDGGIANFVAFAPAPPSVPEPASALLIGTGMFALATFLRRRRK